VKSRFRRAIGIGCMRLSTERETNGGQHDEAHAVQVLHAAFDEGVTFLDTADAYCLDDSDVGHNERLIARALASWSGDRASIVVATKGGLTRPRGEWVPDGRARHLRAACEASLRALGMDRLHLYQLHAPDPAIPLSTSVRALAALRNDGLIERVGLCNVNVGQIEEARRITEIAAVQVELSPWHDTNVLNGVVQYCLAHGIQLIAYRPLGGARRLRRTLSDPVLADVATRHDATPAEIALAWLHDLSDAIVSIPGATKLETVRSIVRAHYIELTDEDRTQLDSQFPLRQALAPVAPGPKPVIRSGEVVLIMGLPGAGKSTVARDYASRGFARLNRDEVGGTLRGLLPALERLIDSGTSRVVLDNTYTSRASRALVVQAAAKLDLPIRCVWLTTSVEEAQVNAAWRMVATHGHLLGPDEMRKTAKRDVSAFPPGVQFRHQRELEPPDPSEGFSRIETMPFERTPDASMTGKALIVWCDDVLLRSRSGGRAPVSMEDVEVIAGRGEMLRRFQSEGWLLLGLSWRPEIAEKTMTDEQAIAGFRRMEELLGASIEVLYCPHGGGPPVCWCRKPLPGLGVVFIQRHRLDASRCIYVGAGPQDPGFARRLGFQYRDANDFFSSATL
jgi:aryl-alcohol dehydrogenase-like predicted oxidoreductase/predicted kinase/histidinol phosphatase-like enzyme